jgi:sulfonate transport system substrate-binding protein
MSTPGPDSIRTWPPVRYRPVRVCCIAIRHNNSYGVVSVTEQYAKEHPQTIDTVIKAYEQARDWALKNPDEFAALLAKESGLPLDVAKLQLSRTDLSSPQLTANDVQASKAAAPILVSEELVRRGVNVDQVIDQLLDSGVQQAVARQ